MRTGSYAPGSSSTSKFRKSQGSELVLVFLQSSIIVTFGMLHAHLLSLNDEVKQTTTTSEDLLDFSGQKYIFEKKEKGF